MVRFLALMILAFTLTGCAAPIIIGAAIGGGMGETLGLIATDEEEAPQ